MDKFDTYKIETLPEITKKLETKGHHIGKWRLDQMFGYPNQDTFHSSCSKCKEKISITLFWHKDKSVVAHGGYTTTKDILFEMKCSDVTKEIKEKHEAYGIATKGSTDNVSVPWKSGEDTLKAL